MKDIAIVLCGVRDPVNVGSACRAMKAMGITDLRLASCPEHELDRVLSLAVHAEDVYYGAARYAELSQALAETSMSAGFTRRLGERRKGGALALDAFAAMAKNLRPGKLALVFGNERTGLTDEELSLCSMAVTIPSSEACPSLNLAQAVQIACWEMAKALSADFLESVPDAGTEREDSAKSMAIPARRSFLDSEIEDLLDFLGSIGFFRRSDSSHVREFLRDICERSGASEEEAAYLSTLFRRAGSLSALHARRGR